VAGARVRVGGDDSTALNGPRACEQALTGIWQRLYSGEQEAVRLGYARIERGQVLIPVIDTYFSVRSEISDRPVRRGRWRAIR
jgi:hypothetical protein